MHVTLLAGESDVRTDDLSRLGCLSSLKHLELQLHPEASGHGMNSCAESPCSVDFSPCELHCHSNTPSASSQPFQLSAAQMSLQHIHEAAVAAAAAALATTATAAAAVTETNLAHATQWGFISSPAASAEPDCRRRSIESPAQQELLGPTFLPALTHLCSCCTQLTSLRLSSTDQSCLPWQVMPMLMGLPLLRKLVLELEWLQDVAMQRGLSALLSAHPDLEELHLQLTGRWGLAMMRASDDGG